MKFPLLGFVVFTCLILINCTKEESANPKPTEPDKEIYFEVSIGSYINTEMVDYWLLIHNEKGELIDYKPFEAEDKITFEAAKDSVSDKFTVTYFHVSNITGKAPYRLESYTNISKGSSWKIGTVKPDENDYQPPTMTGSFNITISGRGNSPSMQMISNSDGNGNGNGAHLITSDTFNGQRTWLFKKTAELFDKNDYYITLLNSWGQTKYYHLPDVQNGDEYNLDFNSFSTFDSSIAMSLPISSEIFLLLNGRIQEPTTFYSPSYRFYSIYDTVGQGISPSFDLGYFGNKFIAYSFSLRCKMENYTYGYEHYGAQLPPKIEVPEHPNFSVENSSISDFGISTDLSYTRMVNQWDYEASTSDSNIRDVFWAVHRTSGSNSKIGALPDELTNSYPAMKISEIKYSSSTLFLNSQNYKQFVDSIFNEKSNENIQKTQIFIQFIN